MESKKPRFDELHQCAENVEEAVVLSFRKDYSGCWNETISLFAESAAEPMEITVSKAVAARRS